MSKVKMIRLDDNNVVTHAFALTKVPTGFPNTGTFHTEDSVADLSGPEQVALFNAIAPTSVTRFASRETGAKRIWARLTELGEALWPPNAQLLAKTAPPVVAPVVAAVAKAIEEDKRPAIPATVKARKARRKKGEPAPAKGPRLFNYTPWPVERQRVPKPGSASETALRLALKGTTVGLVAEATGKSRFIAENILVLLSGNFGYGLSSRILPDGEVAVRAFRS